MLNALEKTARNIASDMRPRRFLRDNNWWTGRPSTTLALAFSAISVVGLGLTGGLVFISNLALRPPTQTTGETPADSLGLDYREVSFWTDDGLLLRGWHLPGHSDATVILVHGYARDRTEVLPEAGWLVGQGYNVLLFDTRAQGSSEGSYIGLGYLEVLDVHAAVDFILSQSTQERIGIMGYSMGAVAAIVAAAEDTRIQAVAAISPFASLRDTVEHRLRRVPAVAPVLIWWGERVTGLDVDILRPVDAVARLAPRPILIMHAGDDAMVPPDSGQRLFDAAAEPKELWFVPGVAHVDFRQVVPTAYRQKIIGFFTQSLPVED